MVVPLVVRSGSSFRPCTLSGEPFMRTAYSVPPSLAVPAGSTRFCTLMAFTTSAGAIPRACSAGRSRSTEITRLLPPYGNGTATPGMVMSCGRSTLTAASNSDCSGSVLLDRPSWMTGMLDAEYLMTSGGVMPGGSWRSCACMMDTTCASAVWMLASGWKKTLMMATPASDCDSMCSMSLTVVVRLRSLCAVMRWPISCADSPP
jgi:hypothetical protein